MGLIKNESPNTARGGSLEMFGYRPRKQRQFNVSQFSHANEAGILGHKLLGIVGISSWNR